MTTKEDIWLKILKNRLEKLKNKEPNKKDPNKLVLGPSDKINYEIKITCSCGDPIHVLFTEENGQIVVETDQ